MATTLIVVLQAGLRRRGHRQLLTAAAACLLGFAIYSLQQPAYGDESPDFQRYEISRLEQPLEMDCATKHTRYAAAANELQLASISGSATGDGRWAEAPQSVSYSKRHARYDVPDVVLTDERREAVDLAGLLERDTPVMLNFIFTTCTTICPVLSASFEQVQALLGEQAAEVLMISVTIDPEYDTPEKLAHYARRFEAGAQWKFLTGQLNDIVTVEKAFDIFRGSKTNHEPVTLLRAAGSSGWLRIEGFANAAEIVKEYQLLGRDG